MFDDKRFSNLSIDFLYRQLIIQMTIDQFVIDFFLLSLHFLNTQFVIFCHLVKLTSIISQQDIVHVFQLLDFVASDHQYQRFILTSIRKIVELITKHHSRLSLIESVADRLRSIFVESTKKSRI